LDVKFFLTGRPGSGKSTLIRRCVDQIRGLGFTVGGISTPEVRRGGQREGFGVTDLWSDRRGILAGTGGDSSFRVGRYGVDLASFESVALPALDYAERHCDVVCVDEIGPMELFSEAFQSRIDKLIEGPKPIIAVIHRRYAEKYGRYGTLLNTSSNRREQMVEIIVKRLVDALKAERSVLKSGA
jgi:nucleoside-triphosphatase